MSTKEQDPELDEINGSKNTEVQTICSKKRGKKQESPKQSPEAKKSPPPDQQSLRTPKQKLNNIWNKIHHSKGSKGGSTPPLDRAEAFKVNKENYSEVGKQFVREFVRDVTAGAEDGWEPLHTKEGVRIFRKKHTKFSTLDLLKGVITINVPPQKVYDTVIDPGHLVHVDKYFLDCSVLERFDERIAVSHYKYKFPFPLATRDFVVLEVNNKTDEITWVSLARSICSSHVSCDKGSIRGEINVSGYFIQSSPDDPNCCLVSFLIQCDPKGNIPKFIINFDAPEASLALARIKNLIEKGIKTFGVEEV